MLLRVTLTFPLTIDLPGVPERRGSGVGSAFSDSSLSPTTKNKPLKEEKIKWKSDIPLTGKKDRTGH